ncbi:unnamed protein product, partial [Aduncisulcus paluster]
SSKDLCGKPTFFPNYGDSRSTWAPAGYTGQETLVIVYDKPVLPLRMEIYETYNPGALIRVQGCYIPCDDIPVPGGFVDENIVWEMLWENTDRKRGAPCSLINKLTLSPSGHPLNVFKLSIDCSGWSDWYEIDAINLVGDIEIEPSISPISPFSLPYIMMKMLKGEILPYDGFIQCTLGKHETGERDGMIFDDVIADIYSLSTSEKEVSRQSADEVSVFRIPIHSEIVKGRMPALLDVPPSFHTVIRAILEYIYSDTIHASSSVCAAIIAFLDQPLFASCVTSKQLISECSTILEKNMNMSAALELLTEKHIGPNLSFICVKYLCKHKKKLLSLDNLSDIMGSLSPEILAKLFQLVVK